MTWSYEDDEVSDGDDDVGVGDDIVLLARYIVRVAGIFFSLLYVVPLLVIFWNWLASFMWAVIP